MFKSKTKLDVIKNYSNMYKKKKLFQQYYTISISTCNLFFKSKKCVGGDLS